MAKLGLHGTLKATERHVLAEAHLVKFRHHGASLERPKIAPFAFEDRWSTVQRRQQGDLTTADALLQLGRLCLAVLVFVEAEKDVQALAVRESVRPAIAVPKYFAL